MADESQAIQAINWREIFPFTHIFRAFWIAIHPSKLVLGVLLIFTLFLGGHILDAFWPTEYLPNAFDVQHYEELRWAHAGGDRLAQPEMPIGPKIGISVLFLAYETQQASALITSAATLQTAPAIHALANFTLVGPTWLIRAHLLYAVLFAAIFLVLWGVFAGAIARIAAVHVARDEKISVRQAVSFSTSKVLSFVFAPLIPVIIITVFGLAIAFGALLFYIPYIGPIAAACLFVIWLLASFLMTLAATGMIAGLNLMYPTIAVEGSDSFDAISRSFSYVFTRPWRMILYSVVALVYGAFCYVFLHLFVLAMLKLTHLFATLWLKGQPGTYFPLIWPSPDLRSLIYTPAYSSLKFSDRLAAGIISFWIYLLIALLASFVISFYFSASTIIYTLMRAEVDATDLGDVYVDETEEDFGDPLPARPSDTAAVVPISETTPPPASSVAAPAPATVPEAPPAAP
jgi:hypothetical protein